MEIYNILDLQKMDNYDLNKLRRELQASLRKLYSNRSRNLEKVKKLELDLCYVQQEFQLRT